MSTLARLARIRVYFLRGYQTIGLPYAFISNAVIVYKLLLEQFIPQSRFYQFVVVLALGFIVVSVAEGYWEFKRSVIIKTEATLGMELNPPLQKLLLDVEKIKKKVGVED